MNSLSLSTSMTGAEVCSFVSGSHIQITKDIFGVELHKSSLNRINVAWWRHLRQSSYRSRCKFNVLAKTKKGQKHDYPWPDDVDPNLKSGHLSYLSHFKPLAEKPKLVTLDFEKPLVELEKKITDVRKMANETGLDFSDQIILLESKYQEACARERRGIVMGTSALGKSIRGAGRDRRPRCFPSIFELLYCTFLFSAFSIFALT